MAFGVMRGTDGRFYLHVDGDPVAAFRPQLTEAQLTAMVTAMDAGTAANLLDAGVPYSTGTYGAMRDSGSGALGLHYLGKWVADFHPRHSTADVTAFLASIAAGSASNVLDVGVPYAADLVPPSPLEIDGGAFIYLDESGITDASGAVASWDSVGSDTTRFSDATDVTERPAIVTVGELSCAQFDGSNDGLRSENTLQLVEPYCVAMVLRIDTFVQSRRILDFEPITGRLIPLDTLGLSWEQGGTDLNSGNNQVTEDEFFRLVVYIAGDGGTSEMRINGVQVGTAAGTAIAPPAVVWALGYIAATGASPCAMTVAELAEWNDMGATTPDFAAIEAWQAYVMERLGV